jgi:hypothetical protein
MCVSCLAGKYSAALGKSACIDCPSGIFANVSGLTSCIPCSPGSYQDLIGKSICLACGLGYFTTKEMNFSSCVGCLQGKFTSKIGLFSVLRALLEVMRTSEVFLFANNVLERPQSLKAPYYQQTVHIAPKDIMVILQTRKIANYVQILMEMESIVLLGAKFLSFLRDFSGWRQILLLL